MQTRLNRFTVLITLVVSCTGARVYGQDITPAPGQPTEALSQSADSLLRAYAQLGRFTGSVLIAKSGTVLLEKGYGFRHVATRLPNDPASIHPIYSITKTFTSTLILKLVEAGKLSLQDRLSRFYPQWPAADSITIEQLLTHTAGLYDYTRGNTLTDFGETSFIQFLQKQPLDFVPGSDWRYSNSGYWLLGFISQKITGIPYEEAIRRFIFQPVGMTRSGFDFKTMTSPQKATGYAYYGGKASTPAVLYDPPGPYAAGAIYSTVGDLFRYHQALQNGTLLTEPTLASAYRPFRNGYGYGWVIDSVAGRRTVGHSGGGAGFRTNLVRVPEDDLCVVILGNCETDIHTMTRNLLNILYHRPYHVPRHKPLPNRQLEPFAGAYRLLPGLTLYVSVEKNHLVAQASSQPPTHLFTEELNQFYVDEIGGLISFVRDAKGVADTLLLNQQGRQQKAPRIAVAWGVTGSATPNSWNGPDVTLEERRPGLWTLNRITLREGEIKFRLNNDWTFNMGRDATGQAVSYGDNYPVKAGTYRITLDLRRANKPIVRLESR